MKSYCDKCGAVLTRSFSDADYFTDSDLMTFGNHSESVVNKRHIMSNFLNALIAGYRMRESWDYDETLDIAGAQEVFLAKCGLNDEQFDDIFYSILELLEID